MTRRQFRNVFVVAVAVLALAAPVLAGGYKGFERGEALVTPEQLKQMMETEKDLVVIAVADSKDYVLGHIPGAVQTWRGDYEPDEKVYGFGGMILDKPAFQEFARKLGVNDGSTVVLYDHKYDATRLWWAFFLYGKDDVKVLDGGYQGWTKAGYDVDRLGGPDVKPGNFVAKDARPGWTAVMKDVTACKDSGEWKLWDTREGKEWTGEELKKGAFRKGRVPWATFQNWKEYKKPVADGEDYTEFKTAAEIQQVIDKYGMTKEQHHVFYCQSGVRTTTNMFALYLMGFDPDHLHNYDGSWIEWSYHQDNPVVVEKE